MSKVIGVQVTRWTETETTNYERYQVHREQRTFVLSDGSVWIWHNGPYGKPGKWSQAELPPPCREGGAA